MRSVAHKKARTLRGLSEQVHKFLVQTFSTQLESLAELIVMKIANAVRYTPVQKNKNPASPPHIQLDKHNQ